MVITVDSWALMGCQSHKRVYVHEKTIFSLYKKTTIRICTHCNYEKVFLSLICTKKNGFGVCISISSVGIVHYMILMNR